ncbi:MAG: hypothetical protein M3130_02885 [Actinomycetota bacterium]|nr:hypothetical protein [Actinomycetota bacterium]
MASRVFCHVGLPKTGTTYLQTVMWAQRERMAAQGVLLPGRERRDHLWATRVIRQDPNNSTYAAKVLDSWDRLKAEIAQWPGTAVVSHEFFAGADAEQAAGMVADLAPADVHVVLTAREPVGLFSGSWQESIKNRDTRTLAEYADAPLAAGSMSVWNWRTLDLRLVLERWAPAVVDANHVHVVTMPPPSAPRELLWGRFAGLLGLEAHSFDLGMTFPNESMGLAEVETLRRVNAHLQSEEFERPWARGVYIRTFLADERLVPRGGERYWPAEPQLEECRQRGRDAVAAVRERGFDVVGDLDDLMVPDQLEPRRSVDSVSEAEVAEVATALVGRMLYDVRALRNERNRLQERLRAELGKPDVGVREAVFKRWPWTSRLLRADQPEE